MDSATSPAQLLVLIDEQIAALSTQTDVRIRRGCDFHLQSDNIDDALAHPVRYTINHNGYLLVEFSELNIFTSTDEILSELVGAGMVPIITHPERNARLQQRLADIARWIELGCCVQVTAGSCTGVFGREAKRCVHELMKGGLVHFVASDAHNPTGRSPSLSEAYAALTAEWGEERIAPLFFDNPSAVLSGEGFDVQAPPLPVKRRKWYTFWA